MLYEYFTEDTMSPTTQLFEQVVWLEITWLCIYHVTSIIL
jgi:hypothetical protein